MQPEILLARSWTALCALLEIAPSGGPNGSLHPIKKQLRWLLDLDVTIAPQAERARESLFLCRPVFAYEIPQGGKPSPIRVRLSMDFFERLLDDRTAPFDLKHLHALQSPLAIDLYCLCTWLSRRVPPKSKTLVVPWKELEQRLGANYKSLRTFRHRVIQLMTTVLRLGPDWKAKANHDGLVVYPLQEGDHSRQATRLRREGMLIA
jgi:hypothetical protein